MCDGGADVFVCLAACGRCIAARRAHRIFTSPTASEMIHNEAMARITELNVNGRRRRIDADSDRTLLSILRNDLDLTGAKYGCGEGQCAACTVLVEGQAAKSCLAKVGAMAGKRIVTIEGL